MIEHPTWSTTQVRAAFADRNVRFWPEHQQEFLASVQPAVEKLAASFGGVARSVHSIFELGVERPGPPELPGSPVARLDWSVEMEIVPVLPGRPTKRYVLTFEPVGGKLLRIVGLD